MPTEQAPLVEQLAVDRGRGAGPGSSLLPRCSASIATTLSSATWKPCFRKVASMGARSRIGPSAQGSTGNQPVLRLATTGCRPGRPARPNYPPACPDLKNVVGGPSWRPGRSTRPQTAKGCSAGPRSSKSVGADLGSQALHPQGSRRALGPVGRHSGAKREGGPSTGEAANASPQAEGPDYAIDPQVPANLGKGALGDAGLRKGQPRTGCRGHPGRAAFPDRSE